MAQDFLYEYIWIGALYSAPLMLLCCSSGAPLVLLWCSSGVPLVLLWYSSGAPLVLLWYSSGNPLMLVWCFSGEFKLENSRDERINHWLGVVMELVGNWLPNVFDPPSREQQPLLDWFTMARLINHRTGDHYYRLVSSDDFFLICVRVGKRKFNSG